jgi:cyclohexadienyl dehydratase
MKATPVRISRLIAAFFIGVLACGGPALAESALQKIQQTGKLRVGTTGDFNPMSFKDPGSNEYRGYDIDVVTQLAKDMEVELVLVPTDWKTLVNGVVADKYDITTSASVNVQRAKVAGFSDGYVEFGTVPMTLKKNLAQFDGWQSIDKADVSVAVTLGTVFEQQAKTFFPKAKIVSVEAPARDYQEVLAGRALVSITSNVEAANLMKAYPELTVIDIDATRARRPGAFLVRQDDQVLINFLNQWIEVQKLNGFFDQLYAKWQIAR